jgi:hypothetical protein
VRSRLLSSALAFCTGTLASNATSSAAVTVCVHLLVEIISLLYHKPTNDNYAHVH